MKHLSRTFDNLQEKEKIITAFISEIQFFYYNIQTYTWVNIRPSNNGGFKFGDTFMFYTHLKPRLHVALKPASCKRAKPVYKPAYVSHLSHVV